MSSGHALRTALIGKRQLFLGKLEWMTVRILASTRLIFLLILDRPRLLQVNEKFTSFSGSPLIYAILLWGKFRACTLPQVICFTAYAELPPLC